MKWSAIASSEFRRGDYRPAAGFLGDIDAIARDIGAMVESYEDSGLGPARAIYLRSSADAMAYVQLHTNSPKPDFITIFLDRRCTDWREQLDQVSYALGIGALEWIAPGL
jgi:hypothetical protein